MFLSMRLTGALAAAVALTIAALPAAAGAVPPYDPDTHESDFELPELESSYECSYRTWASNPKVVIHTGEFTGSAVRKAAMIDAIEDVDEEFNHVGATWARITATEQSTDPFDKDTSFGSSPPAIHVGFVSSLPNAAAVTKPFVFTEGCNIASMNIAVKLDPSTLNWRYNTPVDDGGPNHGPENYWEAQQYDAGGFRYFRIAYQHELLHAFGLDHDADDLSFLNYGNRPWVNRPAADMIRPLPADVQLLRSRYPASGSRGEVAVVTTWFGDGEGSNGAANQGTLCAPSTGADFAESMFTTYCGSNAILQTLRQAGASLPVRTNVCAGDLLRTRFAVANYSTDDIEYQAFLYFSRDTELDETEDVLSPSWTDAIDLGDANSAVRRFTFEVPELGGAAGTEYHPILKLIAVSDEAGAQWAATSDWSPLPGSVTTC